MRRRGRRRHIPGLWYRKRWWRVGWCHDSSGFISGAYPAEEMESVENGGANPPIRWFILRTTGATDIGIGSLK